MKTRYTFKDLTADVTTANRYLLDAPPVGCYFYALGQDGGTTRLYANMIAADGNVVQSSTLDSGTPRALVDVVGLNRLVGYRHPSAKVNRLQMAGMARACGIPMGEDFDALRWTTQQTIHAMAKACGYRKPRDYPGSLGRAFYASIQRAKP